MVDLLSNDINFVETCSLACYSPEPLPFWKAPMALFVKNPGTGVLMVVAAGMFCCTLMGSLIGAMLPFAAKKVGADPATLSSPLITSICDLVGVIIYFALAIAFLSDMIPG